MENKEIIFGRNPVLEYIISLEKETPAVLYISERAHGKIIDLIVNRAREKHLRIEFCSRDEISKYEHSSKHQGVILSLPAKCKRHQAEVLNAFYERIARENGLLILLDQIADPHNLGSIIRSAEALGAAGAIITKAHSAEISATVVKTSAGATAHIPVYTVTNAANFIDSVKKAGFWIIGTSNAGTSDLNILKSTKPAVVVIGSEGAGMRRLIRERCDYIVRIPLKGKISSLNASVAAGIVLYEALKD